MFRKLSIFSGAVLLSVTALADKTSLKPNQVFTLNKMAVFKITATGQMYNGDKEISTGTGFLIDPAGFALTANHVIFAKPQNYKSVNIDVSIGPKDQAVALSATVVQRDAARDVALLRVTTPTPLSAVTLGVSKGVETGSEVSVMGFPLTLGLSIVKGVISNEDGDRWQTDSALNRGNSGGPVFDEFGHVIGMAMSGVVEADGITVEGVKFFTPVDLFRPLVSRRSPASETQTAKCGSCHAGQITRNATEPDGKNEFLLRYPRLPSQRVPAPVETFSRSFPISGTLKNAGTAPEFTREFEPDAGYTFTEAQLLPMAESGMSNATARLVEGGKRAVVTFKLTRPQTGAPAWYFATLVTQQARTQNR